jgi:hypothetical protein
LRTTPTGAAVLLVAGLALAGCAGDGSAADGGSPTASTSSSPSASAPSESPTGSGPADAGTTVDITFKGGKVTPNGDRIKARVGEPVTLDITADKAGEIHVHSTPEQEFEYDAGTSTKTITIDKPGIVDVESHDLEQVIIQLQVS